MQAATAAAPPGAGAQPPREGDGFTFEHLAERESIWLDFVADIGDGGDPTYAVACCMAAPTLLATLPANLAGNEEAGTPPPLPYTVSCRMVQRFGNWELTSNISLSYEGMIPKSYISTVSLYIHINYEEMIPEL
jgi:hypothetical protein